MLRNWDGQCWLNEILPQNHKMGFFGPLGILFLSMYLPHIWRRGGVGKFGRMEHGKRSHKNDPNRGNTPPGTVHWWRYKIVSRLENWRKKHDHPNLDTLLQMFFILLPKSSTCLFLFLWVPNIQNVNHLIPQTPPSPPLPQTPSSPR